MEQKTLGFVEKAYDFARQNLGLVPPYLTMADFGIDFTDAHGLWTLLNSVQQLEQSIDDTKMTAGSEAYQAALVFYKSVKIATAQDVPDAKAVYEELKNPLPAKRAEVRQQRGPGRRRHVPYSWTPNWTGGRSSFTLKGGRIQGGTASDGFAANTAPQNAGLGVTNTVTAKWGAASTPKAARPRPATATLAAWMRRWLRCRGSEQRGDLYCRNQKGISRPVFAVRGKNRLGSGSAKQRRLTHGLRSGGDKRRLRGYGGLGHYAALHSHARLRPHFCAAGTLARSFIAAQKRRKPFCYAK